MSFSSNRTISLGTNDRSEYRLFISHSWDYSQEYERMEELLDDANYFEYRNYSVPEEDAIDANSVEELKEEIREGQIKPSSVVVVLAGLYSSYSDWIGREVRIAEEENKPIIGVEPWGSDNTSDYVERHADEMVGWNTDSIVSAIRELSP
ncbi:TIR domain-containing protein [Halolamina litorea]|uniref:TIR domain-containing protein n=2 Tax=Halolamina litorea TaxID=1515593 RepID=A0ABD6BQT1_9EURY